jgi:hypothetical protein
MLEKARQQKSFSLFTSWLLHFNPHTLQAIALPLTFGQTFATMVAYIGRCWYWHHQ